MCDMWAKPRGAPTDSAIIPESSCYVGQLLWSAAGDFFAYYLLPEHEFSKAKSVMNGSDLLKFPPAALSIFRAILDKRPYRNFGFKWFAHPLSKFRLPSRACARDADMQISLAPPKLTMLILCITDYCISGWFCVPNSVYKGYFTRCRIRKGMGDWKSPYRLWLAWLFGRSGRFFKTFICKNIPICYSKLMLHL